jgi:hypothetical protein
MDDSSSVTQSQGVPDWVPARRISLGLRQGSQRMDGTARSFPRSHVVFGASPSYVSRYSINLPCCQT